nr:adhesion G protein-coupled receptor B2-like isoform X2 [Oncorhynchus nerka]
MEFRYLHLSLREHLAKGQRTLAGEGMSQVVRNLLDLLQRRSYYSGDLLFSTEILRNVTDTFKRATYIPAPDDTQKFFQVVSYMLDMENLEKWEDAHQVSPGTAHLMRILEDFIHLIGEDQKPFQSFLVVTNNLMITIQREPVTAVSSDINFPMKGRRGMKDWARSAEDKLYIPKEVFTLTSEETETETSYFVIGAILYRTLGVILPAPKAPAVINSKILTVTVRPEPKPSEPMVVVELSPLLNGTSDPQCVVWDYGNLEAGAENWDTEGCQTLASAAVHTKCLCSRISTYAILAQQAKDPDMGPSSMPSVPLLVGCGVSCSALLILLLIYAAFWRYIRSERSIILVNFCLSILASNMLILVGQSQTLGKGLCTVTAAFLHFFFLASFCWVLTEAWQSYLAVIGKMRTRLIRKRFLCLGWGLPALVVAVSVGFTRARGYGTPSYCWLSLEGGLLYAFVGPAAVIVLMNMLIGIVVFNKLMSRDGISDKSKKQRAGASLWSSCVVLPLLALTWMSAVLAITDRRSTLFQVLFAVFDSVQGFVIITVHCAMRREVQDAVRCRMGGCKDDSENSPDSCKNGQSDFEKDVDLACQTVIFKEVNTCNPATITGTLSRISLDEEDDPKLAAHQEGGLGVNFSSLPGNIPPPNLLVQVPSLGVLNELSDTTVKKEVNVEQQMHQGNPRNTAPVYLCTESGMGWSRPPPPPNTLDGPCGGGEGDYMVLPRRTVSLKPPLPPGLGLGLGGEDKPLNIAVDDPPFPPPPSPMTLHPAESEAYPADFISPGDHNMNIGMNMNRSYGTLKQLPVHGSQGPQGHMHAPGVHVHGGHMHDYGHSLKPGQRPSVRQILTGGGGAVERNRTLPRNLGSTNTNTSLSAGSLEDKSTPTQDDQHSWDSFKTMTPELSIVPGEHKDRMELHNKNTWDSSSANTPDTSEGDFQTEV